MTATEREQAILSHRGLVLLLARHMVAHLPPAVDLEDLISAGTIGLIEAVDRYDPAREASVRTFAARRIRGAMLDFLRALDPITKYFRDWRAQIESAQAKLQQALGREPDEPETARELGIPLKQYRIVARSAFVQVFRLELQDDEQDERGLLRVLADHSAGDPAELAEQAQTLERLRGAIAKLSQREQLVLKLLFREEVTQVQIAHILGVNESRVSQIKAAALRKLREHMTRPAPLARAAAA
jgi:RNA polymerase sigma factor FliA